MGSSKTLSAFGGSPQTLMKARSLLVFSCAIAPIFLTNNASAIPIYWDGAATGGWEVLANWSSDSAGTTDPGAVPGSSDIATFNIAGNNNASTISLNGNQAVSGIKVTSTGNPITLQGGGTNRTLSIGADGIVADAGTNLVNVGSATANQNVNVLLMANQSWLFNGTNMGSRGIIARNDVSLGVSGSHTLTLGGSSGSTSISAIAGTISDGGGDRSLSITLNASADANRWNLRGNNTYTGLTTITKGSLGMEHANALGSTVAGTTVANNAALFLRASMGAIAAESLTLTGSGSAGSGGALRNVTGTNTWTGTISANTAAGNVAIGTDSDTLTLSSTADITTNGTTGTLLFTTNSGTAGGLLIVSGNISGPASVTKGTSPNNFVRFDGDAKDYTGLTNVSQGTLTIDTALTGTSAVTVAATGTLRGNGGSINTSALTSISGTFAPGSPTTASPVIGTLSMGALTLALNSTMMLDINSSSLTSDAVIITGNLTLDAGNLAKLSVNDLGGSSITSGALVFLKYTGTWNGGLFTVGSEVIGDNANTFVVNGNTYQIDYNYSGIEGNGVALIATVPEPATVALAACGVAALGFRRRRKI